MTAQQHPIRRVVIVGGGTAGWMCAAAAAHMLDDGQRRITLVESDAIGIVGVGEATIPPILAFNAMLGIDEAEFIAATHATFKLGIEFHGWGRPGDRYVHPFGALGRDFDGIAFHQIWLRHQAAAGIGPLEDYWISAVAARQARFDRPRGDPRSLLSGLSYAYHFDAASYAAFLRRFAEARGVERIEGRIGSVEQDDTGDVAAVMLDGGRRVAGDLFVDCSGFRSLLLGEAMGVPYRDWSHWLPCDRAIAVPCERRDPLAPLTRATARPAGWQWRIPLQHRTGNGHVYSSSFMGDDEAEALLLANLDAPASDTPRRLSFVTGRRERMWQGNVVALGLSAGFIEPLESTSIHLIQSGISKLIALFPDRPVAAVERDEYNRLMTAQFDAVRDFVILHYKANQRGGEPFWDHVRTMDIPDSLAGKIALFAEKGRLFRYDDDLFSVPSWVAVLLGQHIVPRMPDPVTASFEEGRVVPAMEAMRRAIASAAGAMPLHADFVSGLVSAANAAES
jgi:tryptophan halogenase